MNDQGKRNGAAFYIALCCCVAVIGIVGYAGRYTAMKRNAEQASRSASANIIPYTQPTPPVPPAAATAAPEASTPEPESESGQSGVRREAAVSTSASASALAKRPDPTPTASPAPAISVTFAAPCGGRVIKEISADELEYNPVLGDWRTHNGIDIALSEGERVKAVCPGTVVEVFSGILGETVIVSCDDGISVVYGCLAGTDGINVGDAIQTGQDMGSAGSTGGEAVTEPHLHLEIIKDGEPVDPRDLIVFK